MKTIYKTKESRVKIWGVPEALFQRVLHADVCLSDLDDTDAASPAKFIALHDWKSRVWNGWDYFCWFAETGWHYLFNGNNVESKRWKKYVATFLKKDGLENAAAIATIDRLLNPEQIKSSLFPGVPELYSLLSAEKFYVSRNITSIVQKYGQQLGFRDAYGEVEQKGNFVERFVQEHPFFQRYLVRGDSAEDQEMAEVLRSCVQRRVIKEVTGIYVKSWFWPQHHGFEIETSRNQTGLAELLKLHKR